MWRTQTKASWATESYGEKRVCESVKCICPINGEHKTSKTCSSSLSDSLLKFACFFANLCEKLEWSNFVAVHWRLPPACADRKFALWSLSLSSVLFPRGARRRSARYGEHRIGFGRLADDIGRTTQLGFGLRRVFMPPLDAAICVCRTRIYHIERSPFIVSRYISQDRLYSTAEIILPKLGSIKRYFPQAMHATPKKVTKNGREFDFWAVNRFRKGLRYFSSFPLVTKL